MFSPQHSAAVAEIIFNLFNRLRHGFDDEEATADVKRALLVRERNGLLRTERVTAARRVIFHITTGGLVNEPLTHVTFVGVGLLRQLDRSQRSIRSKCLVQAEFLTDVSK